MMDYPAHHGYTVTCRTLSNGAPSGYNRNSSHIGYTIGSRERNVRHYVVVSMKRVIETERELQNDAYHKGWNRRIVVKTYDK